jgi:hypothetical protein
VLACFLDEGESLEGARSAETVVIQREKVLHYVHKDLKKDFEFTESQNGGALRYAHEDLRHDPEMVENAMSRWRTRGLRRPR